MAGPTRVVFEFRVRVGLEFRVGLAPLKLDLKLEIFRLEYRVLAKRGGCYQLIIAIVMR